MKKNLQIISVLFVLLAVNLPSFAAITTDELTSEKYNENHGHSDEMARLIDLQKAQINGVNTHKFNSKDPDWYTSDKRVNFIRKAFIYFDCGLDDGDFAQHNTKYTNSWKDNL